MAEQRFRISGSEITVDNLRQDGNTIRFSFAGKEWRFEKTALPDGRQQLREQDETGATISQSRIATGKPNRHGARTIWLSGVDAIVEPIRKGQKSSAASGGDITAPMTGTIRAVNVKKGDKVTAGDTLMVLEAMKLQLAITAPVSGTVAECKPTIGAQVQQGDVLAVIHTGKTSGK
jgi:biotin carboxyl carrier protein